MEQLDEIYKEHARFVYGFLLKKCHNPALAEDLMQETFVVALKKLDTYNGTCKITTWLCGIANNLWLMEQRQNVDLPLTIEGIYEDVLEWESLSILKYVHKLKEPYKEVVYLRISTNLSFAQIGEIMEKSENWARVTFYRGKKMIKEEYQKNENDM